MAHYINRRIHTDIKSWMVYDLDEAKGTAMALEVEKRIEPRMVPGGFSAVCVNNADFHQTDEATPMDGAEPFAITRNKNGVWGFWHDRQLTSIPADSVTDINAMLAANPKAILEDCGASGRWITWYELTPKGKRKGTFEKLGKLENTCRYFYDYNF